MSKGLKRMTQPQFKSAKSLIKNLCCNFDSSTERCLMLDDYYGLKCPQLITVSLTCKFFRDVLLEDKSAQVLKAQIFADDHVKSCKTCGKPFRALSNRAMYCDACSKQRKLQRQREYMAKRRNAD